MSKRDSKEKTNDRRPENKPFRVEYPEEMSGLFYNDYDRVLVSDELSDKDVVLLSMELIQRKVAKSGVKYSDCKNLFVSLGRKEQNFSVAVKRATKDSLIERKDDTLRFRVRGKKRLNEFLARLQRAPVRVIKAGQGFSAMTQLEEFLDKEVGSDELLICDPYISPATLHPLAVLKGKVKAVKVLTTNIQDSDKFGNYRKKLENETGMTIEIKISRKIHDRYIVSGSKCWSIGASIKDLGKKDTIIHEISEVTTSLKDLFEERWNEPAAESYKDT